MKQFIILITLVIFAFPLSGECVIKTAQTRDFNGVKIYDSTASCVRMVVDEDGVRHIAKHNNDGTVTSSRSQIVELPIDTLSDDTEMELTEKGSSVRTSLSGMVLASELSESELAMILMVYEPYEIGKAYIQDALFRYESTLYVVNQPHTSQSDWIPGNGTEALYSEAAPAGVIPEWVQPGSANPYMMGDKVSFNGVVYESLINANVWSPAAYPAGWRVFE